MEQENKKNGILKEITQPFIDLAHSSRALLGVNLAYMFEGVCYFGVISLLALYFGDYIGLNDVQTSPMMAFLTAGITIAMLFLGATVDWVGIRKALIIALVFLIFGRVVLSIAPIFGGQGMWGSAHLGSMLGILGIVIGFGIFMPTVYSGVKMFTDAKTAAMGYAMLYAVNNLGGFLPGLISPPVRKAFGITGVFWVYAVITVSVLILVYFVLSKKAIDKAIKDLDKPEDKDEKGDDISSLPAKERMKYYIKNFPLRDARFMFFIFILMPVQTLFAHNYFTIPQYTKRAFDGFVSSNFEFFSNLSPLLVFILAPVAAALTSKKNTYSMMVIGTFVMALPAFILALGPTFNNLMLYLVLMTIGEVIWQPRFLQWVAEIAPKNMTGIYMGLGQLPWFLTKVFTSLYSGWFLMNYCPADASVPKNTEFMWLVYGFIAIVTPVSLLFARSWMVKGFKTKN